MNVSGYTPTIIAKNLAEIILKRSETRQELQGSDTDIQNTIGFTDKSTSSDNKTDYAEI